VATVLVKKSGMSLSVRAQLSHKHGVLEHCPAETRTHSLISAWWLAITSASAAHRANKHSLFSPPALQKNSVQWSFETPMDTTTVSLNVGHACKRRSDACIARIQEADILNTCCKFICIDIQTSRHLLQHTEFNMLQFKCCKVVQQQTWGGRFNTYHLVQQ